MRKVNSNWPRCKTCKKNWDAFHFARFGRGLNPCGGSK